MFDPREIPNCIQSKGTFYFGHLFNCVIFALPVALLVSGITTGADYVRGKKNTPLTS